MKGKGLNDTKKGSRSLPEKRRRKWLHDQESTNQINDACLLQLLSKTPQETQAGISRYAGNTYTPRPSTAARV